MPAGLSLALLLLAPAAAAPAETPPAAAPSRSGNAEAEGATDGCDPSRPSTDPRQINICAQRPDGYRINPDLIEARKLKRSGRRPKPPERMVDKSCASVGPMGCGPPAGINLVGAALTAAQMAARLAKGEDIGRMFVTDPTPSEYQLYLEAKRAREAREAEERAKAKAAEAARRPPPADAAAAEQKSAPR
ncbi:MAG TPA: hypothetical protein VJM15_07950 [Sphingomicrobium sp.]|nr:hypothetical protein [Sphingomicrobium sp.]